MPANSANCSRILPSVTRITEITCSKLDDEAAIPEAMIVSSCVAEIGSWVKARIERWLSMVSITGFMRPPQKCCPSR
ncbi:Uncharacterised protein [Vibrio cholerae]|nr:Uncharacterised protein [Vibrio cholerae]CSI67103.1 Uncharacterised protein [Vibrio cholerae]